VRESKAGNIEGRELHDVVILIGKRGAGKLQSW
jgi:hypothetical protein